MKLGVLSWEPDELESVGIAEKARERGHEVVSFTIDDINCVEIPGGGTTPRIGTEPVGTFDMVLSRAHVGYQNWRHTVERLQLLSTVPGLILVDPVDAHVQTVSKFAMLNRLTTAGIRIPETRSCRSLADVRAAHRDWGAVVLKPSVGFGGIDVERFLGELTDTDCVRIEGLLTKYGEMICQRYCPHGGDLRVLIIDGEPALGVQFTTSQEAWKPFPGTTQPDFPWDVQIELVDPPSEAVTIAARATAAMGLSYSGVDMVRVDGEFFVMEVNVVPGWDALPPDIRSVPERLVVDLLEKRFAESGKAAGENHALDLS